MIINILSTFLKTFLPCSYCRCFGFLEFKDPASLAKVIEEGPHTVDGKLVCLCVLVG